MRIALPLLPSLLLLLTLAPAADAQSSPARDALAVRFAPDPEAQLLALSLYDADGDDVDTLPAEAFDGGYRGVVRLVPALPVGAERATIWTGSRGALRDFDTFFAALGRYGAPGTAGRGGSTCGSSAPSARRRPTRSPGAGPWPTT